MKKVAGGRTVESYSEFIRRVEYGTQLDFLVQRAGVELKDLEKSTTRGIRNILRNTSLPSLPSERKLMLQLGFIPVFSVLNEGRLQGNLYYTEYKLLGDILMQEGYTIKEFGEKTAEYGANVSSTAYAVLRGDRMSYAAFNSLLGYLGYQLDVSLLPVDWDRFQQYLESIKQVYREQGVYETGVELLLNAPKSAWFSTNKEEQDFTPRKKIGHTEVMEMLERIQFASGLTPLSNEDKNARIDREELPIQAAFLKSSLNALELAANLCGRKVRYMIWFDEPIISMAKNGANTKTVTGYRDMIAFIGAATYGTHWESSMPKAIQAAYQGRQQLRITGLAKLLRDFNAQVRISIS